MRHLPARIAARRGRERSDTGSQRDGSSHLHSARVESRSISLSYDAATERDHRDNGDNSGDDGDSAGKSRLLLRLHEF